MKFENSSFRVQMIRNQWKFFNISKILIFVLRPKLNKMSNWIQKDQEIRNEKQNRNCENRKRNDELYAWAISRTLLYNQRTKGTPKGTLVTLTLGSLFQNLFFFKFSTHFSGREGRVRARAQAVAVPRRNERVWRRGRRRQWPAGAVRATDRMGGGEGRVQEGTRGTGGPPRGHDKLLLITPLIWTKSVIMRDDDEIESNFIRRLGNW